MKIIEIQSAVLTDCGRLYGIERIRQLIRKFHAKSLNPKFHTIEVDEETANKVISYLTYSALARKASGAKK